MNVYSRHFASPRDIDVNMTCLGSQISPTSIESHMKANNCKCSMLNAILRYVQAQCSYGNVQGCLHGRLLTNHKAIYSNELGFCRLKNVMLSLSQSWIYFYPNLELEIYLSQISFFHDYNVLRYKLLVPGSHMVGLLISWVEVDCKTLQSLLCHILQIFYQLQAHGMLNWFI